MFTLTEAPSKKTFPASMAAPAAACAACTSRHAELAKSAYISAELALVIQGIARKHQRRLTVSQCMEEGDSPLAQSRQTCPC